MGNEAAHPTERTGRIRTLDMMKGLVITAIVFVHLFVLQGTAPSNSTPEGNPVLIFFYMWLMMFFLISGYFFRPGRSYKENLKKRIGVLLVALVICYLTLPLILMAYLALLGQSYDVNEYFSNLLFIFGNGGMFLPYGDPGARVGDGADWIFMGYYYIQIMLITFVLFYAIAGPLLKDMRKMAVAIPALVVLSVLIYLCSPVKPPLFLDVMPVTCAFMLTGATAARYGLVERIESGGWKHRWYWISFIIAIVVAVLMIRFFPQKLDYGSFEGLDVIAFFIEALASCYVGVIVVSWLSKIPRLSDFFGFVGKHTLGIIMLHGLIAKMIIAPFMSLQCSGGDFPPMEPWFAAIVGVLTIAICLVICVYGPKVLRSLRERLRSAKSDGCQA